MKLVRRRLNSKNENDRGDACPIWIGMSYIVCAGENDDHQDTVMDKVNRRIDRAIAEAVAKRNEEGMIRIDGRALGISTLSRDVMRAINNAGLDAEFSYDYGGHHYVIIIPAGQAPVLDDVPYCGPMYLWSLFGRNGVVTPIVPIA